MQFAVDITPRFALMTTGFHPYHCRVSTPVRILNLQRLVAEFGDVETVAALSDVDEGHLRSILRGDKLKSGATRGVGNNVAKKLQDGCGKPEGWIDTMPGEHRLSDDASMTPEKRKLMALYDRAPEEIRRLIISAAELTLVFERKGSLGAGQADLTAIEKAEAAAAQINEHTTRQHGRKGSKKKAGTEG